jgi:hypothetical protein
LTNAGGAFFAFGLAALSSAGFERRLIRQFLPGRAAAPEVSIGATSTVKFVPQSTSV